MNQTDVLPPKTVEIGNRSMNKKKYGMLLLGLLVFAFCFSNASPSLAGEPNSSSADSKPNIVFIFADDWGWGDLSCHGHPYVKTPYIDRLAREGTDFHRFTVASGVCSPSRAAVMTGHFPARYNIDGHFACLLYTSPSPRDATLSRMPSSA